MEKITNLVGNIPIWLKKELKQSRLYDFNIGVSGTKTFLIDNSKKKKVLKLLKLNKYNNLYLEKQRLDWLQGKIPVAKVLCYTIYQNYEYLMLDYIEGVNAFDKSLDESSLTKLLAQGLQQIHQIKNCPFGDTIDSQIENAEKKKNEIFDQSKFIKIFGRSSSEIFKEMIRIKPDTYDLVFTHGDYCLPNILINNNVISGFIDLCYAGISDKYQDISICLWSLIYNEKQNLIPNFLEDYGIKKLDQDRVKFFQYLHAFKAFNIVGD